jgi:membrane protease YdiL (CAAX protease family)
VADLKLSLVMAVGFVLALALRGQRPYVQELRGGVRQALGAVALVLALAVLVFMPVASLGGGEVADLETLPFPLLFLGHILMGAFLLFWWWLQREKRLSQFLHLSARGLGEQLRLGVTAGGLGWLLAVAASMTAATLVIGSGAVPEPEGPPPVMAWIAELSLWRKLAVIAAAMTLEEAFFRAFLQPRVGLLASSVLFALAHFSYGLPFLVVGVFTLSLVLGYTFERKGQLLPCVVAHGVFDAVQLLCVLPIVLRWWPGDSAF